MQRLGWSSVVLLRCRGFRAVGNQSSVTLIRGPDPDWSDLEERGALAGARLPQPLHLSAEHEGIARAMRTSLAIGIKRQPSRKREIGRKVQGNSAVGSSLLRMDENRNRLVNVVLQLATAKKMRAELKAKLKKQKADNQNTETLDSQLKINKATIAQLKLECKSLASKLLDEAASAPVK